MESLDKNDLKDLKNFFKNRTKNIKDEKDQILSIIGPHLEKIDNSKLSEIDKYEHKKELNDLGNFIRLYDDAISIKEALTKAPDFLIGKGKKLMGVELSEIQSDTLANETKIDVIFREVEDELKSVLSEVKGVYKIKFNKNLFTKTEDALLKSAIINCIKNSESGSEYIEHIEKSSSETFYLLMHEISSKKPLHETTINEMIVKKEKKVNAYKSLSNVKDFWLLLVLNDIDEYASIIHHKFNTTFEKVFICDFTNSKIIELKKT